MTLELSTALNGNSYFYATEQLRANHAAWLAGPDRDKAIGHAGEDHPSRRRMLLEHGPHLAFTCVMHLASGDRRAGGCGVRCSRSCREDDASLRI
jgi:hypothetical protein